MNKKNTVFVTILVPARNEASCILACLENLNQLNYPKNQLEILVGNDNSTDDTEKVISKFIQNHPQFRLISISENDKKVAGKAGVLEILAQQAKGDFLFMTDADTCVSTDWIWEMLDNFEKYG